MSTSSQPERDRHLVSEIQGEVRHHALRRELTADEDAASGDGRQTAQVADQTQVGQS